MPAERVSMEVALVGLDLSKVSDFLVDWLPYLMRVGTATLILAHVIPVEKLEHVAGGYPVDKLEKELIEEALKKLEEYARRLREKGFTVEVPRPVIGDPAPTLALLAEKHRADYIVVGSRGKGWLRSILLGSTAEELANISRHTVLVAKEFKKSKGPQGGHYLGAVGDPFKGPVVAAVDLGEYTDIVMAYAALIGSKTGAQVLVMHVMEPGEDRDTVKEKVKSLVEDLKRLEVNAEPLIVEGNKPGKKIVEEATRLGASLIIVGPGVKKESILLGTTSEIVVRRFKGHVLVAKKYEWAYMAAREQGIVTDTTG